MTHFIRSAVVLSGLLLGMLLCGCTTSTSALLASMPGPRDLPFIHKVDVQQGNVVTQEMVAQLHRGMDKKKVTYVMGTPVIQDTFNANRWDYIYTYQPGGNDTESRRITLIFDDDKLQSVEGNVKPAAGLLEVATHQDMTVDVPKDRKKSLISKLTPFGDDEPTAKEGATDKDKPTNQADGATAEGEAAAASASPEDAEAARAAAAAAELKAEEEAAREAAEREAALEAKRKFAAYDDIQAAPGEGIVVPPDAPKHMKKKGFFTRLVDGVGLGAEDDGSDEEYEPGDPKYKDVSNPDDL